LSAGGPLPRLPFSREEAKAILAASAESGSRIALDFTASRPTATDHELSQYRIVHFATHGLLNNDHPELSGLVLSLVDENGNPQNGFLRLYDIYNMTLKADLVVLSACQTALGREVKGEGILGVTRGFMYAGAARVLASLWRVDDEATAELMKRFYHAIIKDGRTPSAALQEAQMWMQRQSRWRDPYYWAAYVLQGGV
jgi:CHAT domain-containing protein